MQLRSLAHITASTIAHMLDQDVLREESFVMQST